MARRQEFDFSLVTRTQSGYKGRKPSRRKVFAKEPIDVLHGVYNISVRIETRSRISAAYGGKQGGPDSMAGHIGKSHHHASIAKHLPIKVITTGSIGRQIPSADIKAIDAWPYPRQQRLLNGSRNFEIVLHLL